MEKETSKPKKDRLDGVAIMNLVNACTIGDTAEAVKIMEEIEQYQYETDNDTVEFLREKINNNQLEQIVQKFNT